jgi:hypothetical protein
MDKYPYQCIIFNMWKWCLWYHLKYIYAIGTHIIKKEGFGIPFWCHVILIFSIFHFCDYLILKISLLPLAPIDVPTHLVTCGPFIKMSKEFILFYWKLFATYLILYTIVSFEHDCVCIACHDLQPLCNYTYKWAIWLKLKTMNLGGLNNVEEIRTHKWNLKCRWNYQHILNMATWITLMKHLMWMKLITTI